MTLWLAASLALAAPVDSERGLRVPPVRIGARAALRAENQPTANLELGLQAWRSRVVSVEAFVNHEVVHTLMLPGQVFRAHYSWGASQETLFHANRFAAVGPCLAVGIRSFDQQGLTIQNQVVPSFGAVAQVQALRSRTWGLAVTARVMVEPVPTQMLLHTQQIETLSPFDLQLGTRVLFGHGRVEGVRQ
jgi:hypothetical protein